MNSEPSGRRVVVTGSSGLIGTALCESLAKAGHPIVRLVRSNPGPGRALWDPAKGTIDTSALEGAWAVVHLAGEGIADSKWTEEHKARVMSSRVLGTTLLSNTIAGLTNKPEVFASGSAIGFYGDRGSVALDETAAGGTGFLADVVKAWEAPTRAAADAGVRVALLRTGIVLSTRGGALKQQLLPFKLGLGGRLGSGKQYLPWVTITDEVAAIQFILATPEISGPVNLTAPNPVTNSEFTKALGAALKRPTLIPIPLLPLKLLYSAEMVQEMLLASANVVPTKLLASGFTFAEVEVASALRYVLDSHV
jgi:uncharacterized protein